MGCCSSDGRRPATRPSTGGTGYSTNASTWFKRQPNEISNCNTKLNTDKRLQQRLMMMREREREREKGQEGYDLHPPLTPMERMQLICRAFGEVLLPNECKRREYSRTAGKRNRTWSSDNKKDERKLQETNKRGGKRPHAPWSL